MRQFLSAPNYVHCTYQCCIELLTVATQLHNTVWSLLSPLELEMETTVEEVEELEMTLEPEVITLWM